jgi:hypothetical protein
MPCDCSYLEATEYERELQRTAKLLVYVFKATDKLAPKWVYGQAKDCYASDKRLVPLLCAVLGELSCKEREQIIYDAHSKSARDLANWWERHQAADKARIVMEKQDAEKKKLKAQALRKLSDKERKALGL